MNPPSKLACLTYMLNQNRQLREACLRYDEPESPKEGACLRFMMNPNREMRAYV